MSHNENINIDYIARVEGEAALAIELDGQPSIQLRIYEPPRFFEGFLVGRRFDEVGDIVSRICGICPVSHMTTAVTAIEQALGIDAGEQAKIMRRLMCVSQIVASHLVHLYMLAMPDYYGLGGIGAMTADFKNEVGRLIRMKSVMNSLTALIGGRALHPVNCLPGGFTSVPAKGDLSEILVKLREIKAEALSVIKDVASFKMPDYSFGTQFVSLRGGNYFGINEGRIVSGSGLDIPIEDYKNNFVERETKHSFAKQSFLGGDKYFISGALARANNKFSEYHNETKTAAEEAGFRAPCFNPFMNNLAQALEVHDGILQCIDLIEGNVFYETKLVQKSKSGTGSSVTEAPRGLLYHSYMINGRGIVEKSNIVTPTSHNFAGMEAALKQLTAENMKEPRERIRLLCEELVRAFDPCFSCSVH